jgi:hypothetical protein
MAKALENGTDSEEIARLQREVNEGANKMGATMVSALKSVLATMAKQAADIEAMKGQIRKGRDLK